MYNLTLQVICIEWKIQVAINTWIIGYFTAVVLRVIYTIRKTYAKKFRLIFFSLRVSFSFHNSTSLIHYIPDKKKIPDFLPYYLGFSVSHMWEELMKKKDINSYWYCNLWTFMFNFSKFFYIKNSDKNLVNYSGHF